MTEEYTKLVVDCATGEKTVVELTTEEIAQLQQDRIEAEARRMQEQVAEQAMAEAKASGIAKLLALGLTQDEANALVK